MILVLYNEREGFKNDKKTWAFGWGSADPFSKLIPCTESLDCVSVSRLRGQFLGLALVLKLWSRLRLVLNMMFNFSFGLFSERKCSSNLLHSTMTGVEKYYLSLDFFGRIVSEKQVGLSRATLDSQVKVFHSDLTGLPSKSIQWVNNSTVFQS